MTVDWLGPWWLERPAIACGVLIFHRPVKLSLEGPDYTDSAVEHIVRLRDLKHLWLGKTHITDEGLARLKRSLPKCRIVRDDGSSW